MRTWVDGERATVEVVRDHLTRTIRGGSIEHLSIGSRFRDRGFKGGAVRSMRVMDLPPEVPSPTNTLRAARAQLAARDERYDAFRDAHAEGASRAAELERELDESGEDRAGGGEGGRGESRRELEGRRGSSRRRS